MEGACRLDVTDVTVLDGTASFAHNVYMQTKERKMFTATQSTLCHWFWLISCNMLGVPSRVAVTDDFGNIVRVDHAQFQASTR